MRSRAGSTRQGSAVTRRPLTRSRPARIANSASRRENTPASASAFCSRSPSGGGAAGGAGLRRRPRGRSRGRSRNRGSFMVLASGAKAPVRDHRKSRGPRHGHGTSGGHKRAYFGRAGFPRSARSATESRSRGPPPGSHARAECRGVCRAREPLTGPRSERVSRSSERAEVSRRRRYARTALCVLRARDQPSLAPGLRTQTLHQPAAATSLPGKMLQGPAAAPALPVYCMQFAQCWPGL